MSVPITAEHTTATKLEPQRIFTLTASDRCDACHAARAYVRAFASGWMSELLLCKHHADEHEEALMPQCLIWQDEREAVLL